MISYNYIDSQVELNECCLKLKNSNLLAVDTEFVRERTFFPQPGLIQVSDGLDISLIDPNAKLDLQVFFDLLESPDIRIIMHSSSEDIELFYHMGCGLIQNLFDTQIAASWLGDGLSLSLQKLIENFENVYIEKQHSRTNWLKRPLSKEQLDYAAIDVLYLNSICLIQEQLLKDKNFLDNMIEDCVLRCARKSVPSIDKTAYLRVKKAITASGSALGRLKYLASWREQQARTDDKPRQHVIKDLELLALALQNPQTVEQLSTQCAIPSYVVRRYGEKLLMAVKESNAVLEDSNQEQSPVLSLKTIQSGGNTLNDFRELMKLLHKKHKIPVEVLPSKRWLEQFLLHQAASWYPEPDGWNGWRKCLLEDPFLEIIKTNGFNSDTVKT
ncbi:MAG: ribonuclease D [Enterobacterales bacterium]